MWFSEAVKGPFEVVHSNCISVGEKRSLDHLKASLKLWLSATAISHRTILDNLKVLSESLLKRYLKERQVIGPYEGLH